MTHIPNPPNPPSGPYKSRLFNLLNRQRWLWRDRLVQTSRHLQRTAVWTGQILLYPLYLLTQLGRGWGLRLEAAISGKTNSLPKAAEALPARDRPIQNTLAGLEDLFAEISVAPAPALALPSATHLIRAIASDRTSHNLVLVTAGNQAQDCLNPDQQQQLRQLMLWEMSDAAHQRYLLKVRANQYRLPQRLTRDAKIWRPVQRFWQLMVWLQHSPIAVAANVFGEAEFATILALPPSPPLPQHLPAALPPWLGQLDGRMVNLETCQSYLDYEWRQWWQAQNMTPTHRLAKLKHTLQQTVQQSLTILFSPSDLVTVTQTPSPPNAAWLNWEDLTDPRRERFAATIPQDDSLIEAEMVIDLALLHPEESRAVKGAMEPSSLHPLPLERSQTAAPTMAPDAQLPLTPPSTEPPKTNRAPAFPIPTTAMAAPEPSRLEPLPSGSPLTRPGDAPADPDYQPDWIEVNSEPMGYEQHFLARLLNRFDRMMLMIEETAIASWQWLKRVWRRKS